MKKGYIRLLAFELIIFVLLLLNSFVLSILNRYWGLLFLVIISGLFKVFFGFEKDRNRYWKTVCLDVTIFLLAFFLAYYLIGIPIGFYKTINYYTLSNLKKIFIPLIGVVVLKELLRYMMLKKSEGSRLLIVTTCFLFILFDLNVIVSIPKFHSFYDVFIFIALYVLPYTSKNIVCTYISIKDGYKPTILYILVMELYIYLIPIIPNPNQYIYSLIHLLAPFVLLFRLHTFYKKDRDEQIEYSKQKKEILSLIPCIVIISILVYFTSGYFRFHAIVIGSGSMEPHMHKGDVVVVDKGKANIDKLEIGQVIAVKHQGIIVVHRIVKKIAVNEQYVIYTKGDANNDIDSYKVTKDMIYGTVDIKIPFIGYLPVWLRDL